MTRMLKSLSFLLLSSTFFAAQASAQTTIKAASCNVSDVAAAIGQATADGDVVAIPAGDCIWTTPLQATIPNSLTVQGAGAATPQGGSDKTIIEDGVNHSTGDPAVFQVTTTAGKSFRLTGIAFYGYSGNTSVTYNGVVRIYGGSHSLRVDHCHFYHLNSADMVIAGWLYGVVDHCLFDEAVADENGVRVEDGAWNNDAAGFGDQSWADAPYFGSDKFVFIEDCTFNWQGSSSYYAAADDCEGGGRLVFRHNTLNGHVYFQTHETSNDLRGCRAVEVYDNTATASTNPSTDVYAFFIQTRSGTGLVWGNTTTSYLQLVNAFNDRSTDQLTFAAPPNGWGYCGITRGPSAWDQNTDSTGYACLDQVGRGKEDLLAGVFPNKVDSVTNTITWPNQAVEPYYVWDNTYNPPPNEAYDGYFSSQQPSVIKVNRDYYVQLPNYNEPNVTFNGTAGVGQGLLSARPSTCAAGPGGNTPGVAYWATDANNGNGELYVCTAANTWTAFYKPYQYPHPLDTDSPQTTSGPPSNLRVTSVQ